MLEVTRMHSDGVDVVAVSGKIVGSQDNFKAFHEMFQSLIAEGSRKFIIDLEETPWTNSLGIGMLIGAYASVKNNGGDVVLANPTERIRDLLKVTKLFNIFEVFDTIDEAVARLGRGK
jgi:anti-sigma B factor antagonist